MDTRDAIDLGRVSVPRLFKMYFMPTLLGMLAICAVTAADGIFIGRGVGSEGVAAVNIAYSPVMVLMGIGLMLGVGASVVASIHLSDKNIKAARINVTQALAVATLATLVFLAITLVNPSATARILGASPSLEPLVLDYIPWVYPMVIFQEWCAIGLFVVRLDGSPRYAMWCNVAPGLINIVLDYVFVFPLDMGVRGAAIATFIACAIGGIMVIAYLVWRAQTLTLYRLKLSVKSLALTCRNIWYQCTIGVSALLGETTMGVLMLMGNLLFMRYLGDAGVGAFGIACYYCPFIFMIGNAIAQSAQPIISYNYGLGSHGRVVATERLAIYAALACGLIVTAMFIFTPVQLVDLFLEGSSATKDIAVAGFPLFSVAIIFFIFNLTAIGYFQSVKRVMPSIIFALLRGGLLVPSFLLMPQWFGEDGLWLALGATEILTAICITAYYLIGRMRAKKTEPFPSLRKAPVYYSV